MNKKRNFAKVALLSALLCGVAGPTFVGCKDYDDDIQELQEQIDANKSLIASIQEAIANKKFISDYKAITNGYELIFSDGSTLTILNGEKGEKGEQGEQGIQGIQGIQGVPGATAPAIIPQFRTNEGFWEVSVDEGKTYKKVLDENGEPVKASSEVSEAVSIDEDGFLVIGGQKTGLNVNPKYPSIVYNEADKTFIITVDGQSLIIPQEGSDFNGLQTLIYRRMAWDDCYDYVYTANVYYTNETKKDILLASIPGKLEFKIFPETFDTKKAEFNFFDTRKVARSAEPTFDCISSKAEAGILSLEILPKDMPDGDYVSSLNVTLNKNTTCSDYFNVRVAKKNIGNLQFFVRPEQHEGVLEDQVEKLLAATKAQISQHPYNHYTFVYTEAYSLKDSIALGFDENDRYVSLEDLKLNDFFKVTYEATEGSEKGIFTINKETGVITVNKDKQSSAINEFCYVTITYTIVDKEGKEVKVFTKDLAIKAVKEQVDPLPLTGIEILPAEGSTLLLTYSAENTQVIKLDVRDFEAKLGGRDVLNENNSAENSRVWRLGYYENEVLKVFPATLPDAKDLDIEKVVANEGEMYLYFKAGTDATTNLDALYLVVGPKTRIEKNTFYALDENNEKDVIENKNFYVKDVEVVRYVNIVLKDEYKPLTMTGIWNGTTEYTMQSVNMNLMYTIVPSDLQLRFALSEKSTQSAEVQKLIENGQINIKDGIITIAPKADLTKNISIKIDIFDKNEKEETATPLKSEIVKIQNPISAIAGTVPAMTFNVVNISDTYKTVGTASKNNKLTLKDVRNNDLFKFEDDAYAVQSVATRLYGKGFKLTYSIDKAASEFGIKIVETTGTLSLDKNKITEGMTFSKKVTVTMTVSHDWGETTKTYPVSVVKAN